MADSCNFMMEKTSPYPLGVRVTENSLYVSMESDSPDCGILLYKDSESPALRIGFPRGYRVGKVYAMCIIGLDEEYTSYQLYSGNDILADAYAKCFVKRNYGVSTQEADLRACVKESIFDWQDDQKPCTPFSEAVFYGLHVRGFTKDASSGCRFPGTFKGIVEKLDYLKALGVTSLMLMPAYEFMEQEMLSDKEVLNYWGYKKGFYYAPKASYAYGTDAALEMKELVRACHAKDLELFMQFYFPTEVSQTEALHILEYWALEYHIDGFQIMTAHMDGKAFAESAILADTKLIFQHASLDMWNTCIRSGYCRMQSNCDVEAYSGTKRICLRNTDSRNIYRRFLRGEEHMLEPLMHVLRKNDKHFAFMNDIADYEGFRLLDLVSYDYKHNEANGEHNLDGNNYNYSANNGVEGPTDLDSIRELRLRQMKNAMSLVLFSQATPYFFMGDEMGQTQAGNNNPYNQDNAISWLDWSKAERNKDWLDFVKQLIKYRKTHSILSMGQPLDGSDTLLVGYPNLSFHGIEVYRPLAEPYRKELGMLLCGKYAVLKDGLPDSTLYIAFNMHNVQHTFMLPKVEQALKWKVALTSALYAEEYPIISEETCHVDKYTAASVRVLPPEKTVLTYDTKQYALHLPAHSMAVLETYTEQ